MTNDAKRQRRNAEKFARRVIEKEFGQQVDQETLESIVEKILKVLPEDHEEPVAA